VFRIIYQERVQEEQNEIYDKHDRKGENGVVTAERIIERFFVTILDLHSSHGPDWVAKGKDKGKSTIR